MFSYFQEQPEVGNIQRGIYLSDIKHLIEKRREECTTIRSNLMANYPNNINELREKYLDMLGWPLNMPKEDIGKPCVEYTFLGSDEQADIYRVSVETLPDLHFGGILFRAKDGKKHPLVISQHGGGGTPELCSSMYNNGDSTNYNEMTRRLLARNVHVFAPQLLLWHQETYHNEYNRQIIDSKLKQVGSSIAAIEIYSIMRCIDVLSENEWVDAERIGMVGLSYGGFYTLFTAAADPRIKSCVAAGFFNERTTYSTFDFVWKDSGMKFLDAEVGAMIAPRGLYMQLGTHDELFAVEPARREYEKVKEYYRLAGCPEKVYMEFFDGIHEFSKSDETIDMMMNDL